MSSTVESNTIWFVLVCYSIQSLWGGEGLSTAKNQPNLKALIRKFGLSILPETAELIIGFHFAEIQPITAAVNHSACQPWPNAPLVLKCFLYSLFHEDTSNVGNTAAEG